MSDDRIGSPGRRVMRADLHVHSYHSGYSSSLRLYRSRDCYSAPEAVYRRARARGMDLVTITDHNSIDGCLEFLDRHPGADDFLVGEEVECLYPGTDLRVHVGVFGLDERLHAEIQRLRPNLFEALAFLEEEGLFFVLHHLFHFYRGQVPLDRYIRLIDSFPAVEVRNGTMMRSHNALIETLVERAGRPCGRRPAPTGGSDAHTLGSVGTTFTEVEAGTRDEFVERLRAGRGRAGGRHGSRLGLAREIYGVVLNYQLGLLGLRRHECPWGERARGLGLSVLSLPFQFVPLTVGILQKSGEAARVARWIDEWEGRSGQASG